MENLNAIIAGFGGQGVLFAGKVLAYCGLMDGKEVSWLPSYGPEMRGGTANCSICISDEPIGSPLVAEPDVLIAMNGPSYDKFINEVPDGGLVVVDSSLVDIDTTKVNIKQFGIPATQLSKDENMGNLANIILLGKMIKETAFSSLETIRLALEEIIPASKAYLLDQNMKAIQLGMSL